MAGGNRKNTMTRPVLPGRERLRDLLGASEGITLGLSVLWVVAVSIFVLALGQPAQADARVNRVLFVIALFLPVAVGWLMLLAVRAERQRRAEIAGLRNSIEGLRQAYAAQMQAGAMTHRAAVEKKLDAIASSQRGTEALLASLTGQRPIVPFDLSGDAGEGVSDEQHRLALGAPSFPAPPPLSSADFIRAMNFPENENDKEGFNALRRVLKDRLAGRLIKASQDILTLLSQDGIYMDDLLPERAIPAEAWRRFAAGARGKDVAALAALSDRASRALTAARMRRDLVFRDAVHHFLRQFDRTFAEFARRATDRELADFAETRTARAFMLLGRVAGTFE